MTQDRAPRRLRSSLFSPLFARGHGSAPWGSRTAGTLCCLALCLALSSSAAAGTVEVSFTATVSSTTGDLAGPLGAGSTISGTFLLDDSVVGSFTPSGNPTFVRSEMLYTGAVSSSQLSVGGSPVSGAGGNVVLLDAIEALAGEDNYEIRAVVDTGSIGGATPATFVFVPEYDFSTFSVTSGDPLFPPPPFDAGRFNPFTLTSASGGTAFGQIDDLEVVGGSATPIPLLPLPGLAVLGGLLAGAGGLATRRDRRSGDRAPAVP